MLLLEQLLPLIQSAGLGILLPALVGWLGVHVRNAFLRNMVIGATKRGAGVMYDYLASRSAGLDPEVAKARAFSAGLDYVKGGVSGAIASLNVSPETVANMLRGHFGDLLASDPTISVQAKLGLSAPVAARPLQA